ncbi:MAG: DNA alkylation repair protein [Candidatus Cloacimonetes bacterium]|nr:DNA alkylation repair protein [Candidatus Cloacimonadota bacterium]
MIKEIGRLDEKEEKEFRHKIEKTLEIFDESPKKGEKKFEEFASCKNYFGRILIAETAANSPQKDKVAKIAKSLLDSKNYAKRATALFFFYNYFMDKPEEMVEIVSNYYHSIKWEAENIMDHFWKEYPDLMKANMMKWIESKDEKKRSLSFHGLENISQKDPHFVMEFIEKIIDDESIEVQKKITHTIIQIARARPAEVYPYLKEWLKDSDNKRIKTIWVSMKKLANSLRSAGGKDKNSDFVVLTKDTIKDWRHSKNRKISTMGEKLNQIIQNR